MSRLAYTTNGKYFIQYTRRAKGYTVERKMHGNSLENLNVGYRTKGISEVTRKKIQLRCRVLNYGAELKEVRDYSGKLINHKISFLTLTLPSEQRHTDGEITKIILGGFLDRCRKLGILRNYVWRAEKQENNNIHYHILTVSYIMKTVVYRVWLLSLEKLGYVSKYREKFSSMDLQTYKLQKFNANVSDAVVCKRFWKGNRNGWKTPPCFDIANISGDHSLENYLSKYISKDASESNLKVTGRVWGCSNGVNEAVMMLKDDEEFCESGFKASKYVLRKKSVISDYFEICLCKLSSFFAWFPDVGAAIITRIRSFIAPCQYHLQGQQVLFLR